jgi:small-conductance mechanosensitive channel
MPSGDVGSLTAALWGAQTSNWIGAVVPIALALAAASLAGRAFRRRGLSRQADTRLRFVRRLTTTTIVLVGVAIGLSQFEGVDRVAASVLASGAIAAAVVGFAAQRTLANFVAGVMLAITQPLRVGDWVHFDGHDGQVEDVRLNFTVLRTGAEQRIIIPNERLASGVLINDTLAVDAVGTQADVWLPAWADADRAVRGLEAETGGAVSIAEVARDGVRLTVGGDAVPPAEKAAAEAELRARCLRRLRAEGLLAAEPAG